MLKAQSIVDELDTAIQSIESGFTSLFSGTVTQPTEQNSVRNVIRRNPRSSFTKWGDAIKNILSNKNLTIMEIYDELANAGSVKNRNEDGWRDEYNEVRSAIYSLESRKEIERVKPEERGSAWKLSEK